MPIQINPPQRPLQTVVKDQRTGFDKDMERIFQGLNILNQGMGIAVNYQKFQDFREQRALRESPESLRMREAQVREQEARTGLAQRQLETAPTAEEAKGLRGLQYRQEQAKAGKMELEESQLQDQMRRLAESPKGVTDFGKPMDSSQLKAQSFLDRSVAATDRMKQQSSKVTPELMSKQIKALREAGTIPVVGGASDFLATVLGEDAMQTLPQADRLYLVNAFELANIILRDETGAAATAQEVAFRMEQFTPQPGNTSADLADKAKLIEEALDGIRTKTGKFSQATTKNPDLRFQYSTIEKLEQAQRQQRQQRINQKIKELAVKEKEEPGLLDQALDFLERMTVPPRGRQRQ